MRNVLRRTNEKSNDDIQLLTDMVYNAFEFKYFKKYNNNWITESAFGVNNKIGNIIKQILLIMKAWETRR